VLYDVAKDISLYYLKQCVLKSTKPLCGAVECGYMTHIKYIVRELGLSHKTYDVCQPSHSMLIYGYQVSTVCKIISILRKVFMNQYSCNCQHILSDLKY
jgi:hypothetical protein